jgi:anti-sigma factor RsiW
LTCRELQNLIDSYLDGELDLMRNLEIEQHVQDCPHCNRLYQNHRALKTAFRNEALYFAPPLDLQKRVQTALRQANQPVRAVKSFSPRWVLAAAVLTLLIIGSSLALALNRTDTSAEALLTQEVIASHVRSLMVDHLMDVVSTDQHTVKPWFNSKLDFAPPVVNLADQGFPLVGGRLDYLDNRTVAALIYQKDKHFINVFIWPATNENNSNPKIITSQGYNLRYWSKSGMVWWTVSDVNNDELNQFVKLLQAQT